MLYSGQINSFTYAPHEKDFTEEKITRNINRQVKNQENGTNQKKRYYWNNAGGLLIQYALVSFAVPVYRTNL